MWKAELYPLPHVTLINLAEGEMMLIFSNTNAALCTNCLELGLIWCLRALLGCMCSMTSLSLRLFYIGFQFVVKSIVCSFFCEKLTAASDFPPSNCADAVVH